jgi:2-polyprenyl-6-methoxyphenol hydroxylase-like FAD-dependent oxidoreductase
MRDQLPVDGFDVAIVGGGFAGTSAALALTRQGLSVCLIDLQAAPRHAFRAEKFSADQLSLLDDVGLLEPLKQASAFAYRSINIRGKDIVDTTAVEDYGLMYGDMVKTLRGLLTSQVAFVNAKVSSIKPDAVRPEVVLDDGRRIPARLVVLATGQAKGIREQLGIVRHIVHPIPTINVGFTLAAQPEGFRFPSLAAYGEVSGDGVDYTSIFPVGDTMRVNVFVFGEVAEPRIRAFRQDPMTALLALQPGLTPWLAGSKAVNSAEFFAVELSTCQGVRHPGLVLIGDAYRTACSAIGNGLSCLLVDVARLAVHAPRWMASRGMGLEKVSQFYDDPIKQQMDIDTHRLALQRRNSVLSKHWGMRARRSLHFARRRLANQLASWHSESAVAAHRLVQLKASVS